MHRTTARLSAALLTAALVGLAGPAYAHVTVSSTDATAGGYGKAVFRVPTESDTASTTRVVLTLPADQPFAFVSAGSKPGWTVKVDTEKLAEPATAGDATVTEAVRTITWTAEGDGIPPGQFDEFAVSGGPFPKADDMAFAVRQTYSDGQVVDWDEPQQGAEEPEHPAPVLSLAAATTSAPTAASGAKDDGSDLGVWLGGAGLVLAAAALLVALRENRRRA